MDRTADLAYLEGGLRRGSGSLCHRPVGEPEHAAVPGTGQAAVRQFPVGQRTRHVTAPVSQHVHRAVEPDGRGRDLAEHLAYYLALGQVGRHHQMLPAGLHQMRDLFRVIRAAGQAEGDMTAEQPAGRDRRQAGGSPSPPEVAAGESSALVPRPPVTKRGRPGLAPDPVRAPSPFGT